MMTCPSFAARSGLCASFLKAETVGLGPSAGLFRCWWTTTQEDSLDARELSVDPPVAGFVVCPCKQLSQAVAISHEVN